jgi:ATP-dependent Clp protease ATP-binding subunit ClpC
MSRSPFEMSESDIRRLCGHLLHESEEEASRLRHNYIGTEHIFNGLTRIPGGTTLRMITESGLWEMTLLPKTRPSPHVPIMF